MFNLSKIGVIGAGNVGAAIVNALVLKNIGKEIVLFNRDINKAIGQAMDIDDTIPLLSEMQIDTTNDYKDLKDCKIIAITIGARQKENETRIQLLERNARIIKFTMEELDKYAPDAIIILVSNPVDILTRIAQETSKRDACMIFGSGTLLDTSRLRYQLGKELNINRKNIHGHVIGEHGDSEFPVWSNAIIGSVKLDHFISNKEDLARIKEKITKIVKERAYEIIKRKGYTDFGVAVAVAKLIQSVIRDEKKIYSVSVKVNKDYSLNENVVLSLPCVIGEKGIENKLHLELDTVEKEKLKETADKLNKAYNAINL
jgi:L-lactate dehydrogenase